VTQNFFDEQSEQSQIKAAIVTDYFWAWANVIIGAQQRYPRHAQKIAYIDLFAGPGRYQDGASSTPLMIMERAVADPKIRDRLVAIFNDKDEANTKSLESEIRKIPGIDQLKFKPEISTGEVGDNLISEFQRAKLIPTFLFVDPFGYKGLSLQLVQSVLKDWGCDCIFFFNYNRINPGLSNPVVDERMDELFGSVRANRLRERFKMQQVKPHEREAFIVEEMKAALEEMCGDEGYVLPFRFRNPEGTRTTHHLFFVSKDFKGYEIMREVMYKHSHKQGTVANFEYNPADARWPSLFEFVRPLGDLEDMLLGDLSGTSTRFRPLFVSHSKGKSFVERNYKAVLCRMEREGKIRMDPPFDKRREGTIGEKVLITFPQ
jgi:three-Cys-motif partner protein